MLTVFRTSCIPFNAVHMLLSLLTWISPLASYTGRKQELGNKRKPRGEDCLLFGTWNKLQLCTVFYWKENYFKVSTRLCRHRRRWPRACCLFDNKIHFKGRGTIPNQQALNTEERKQNPTKNPSGQRKVNNALPTPKNTNNIYGLSKLWGGLANQFYLLCCITLLDIWLANWQQKRIPFKIVMWEERGKCVW